jgi:hypothetical protein
MRVQDVMRWIGSAQLYQTCPAIVGCGDRKLVEASIVSKTFEPVKTGEARTGAQSDALWN